MANKRRPYARKKKSMTLEELRDLTLRGLIAENLGGLVDMASIPVDYIGGALGFDMPDTYYGSSEDIKNRMDKSGITDTERKPIAEAALGLGIPDASDLSSLAMLGVLGMNKLSKGDDVASLLGKHKTTTPRRIRQKTKANQGYSVNLKTGDVPERGYMVGAVKNDDPRAMQLGSLGEMTDETLEQFAKKNKNLLDSDTGYMGTWDAGNAVYLDPSKRYAPFDEYVEGLKQQKRGALGRELTESEASHINKLAKQQYDPVRQATKFGEGKEQLAIYDVEKMEELPVGNWRGYLYSPQFRGKLDELEKAGREYLETHPTREWWDNEAFRRVYGDENVDQMAGFLAATSPNTTPKLNTVNASEYMRRHIKGEPIIQPDFRIPDDAINRTPGVKLGMEAGRVDNLEKANLGLLDEMKDKKVANMAKALRGDPDAAVFDRHWARIAEEPGSGIYTGSVEGKIPKDTMSQSSYDDIYNAVQERALYRGRSMRDYTADVWTGMREKLKAVRGKITGDSKSLTDVFDELIREKAKHVGVSVKEFEKRLRNGDAELLSVMIGTPLGMKLYQEWESETPERGALY